MSSVAKSYQNAKESPQDAEAVARPDLTAETLAWLEYEIADRRRWMEEAKPLVGESVDAWKRQAERLAHAAACVRRVPELEAEVERLREIESHIRGLHLPVERDRHDGGGFECASCYTSDGVPSNYPCLTIVALDAAYAAATRDSRPTPRTDG